MSDWFPPISTEIGNDCLRCHAVNSTPKYYYVSFVGIMMGDDWIAADGPPPNGLYVLTQTVGDACTWFHSYAPGSSVRFEMGAINSFLRIIVNAPVLAFDSTVAVICTRWHSNDQVIPAGNHFWGGHGLVFTPEEIQARIETVTPVVDPDPLFRVDPMANEKFVVSYIDQWGDTKIKLLFDPNA